MSLETWLIFVVVSVVPVISPGPAILLAISNALRYGPAATICSGFGNMLGLICNGFAVAFGLAALMAASALAFTILKVVGAAYLIYLGVKTWRDRATFAVKAAPAAVPKSRSRLFAEGFVVSITNPKAMIILAALLPPFVDPALPALPQVTAMSLTYAGMCFLNHLLIAFAGGWIRRVFLSERRMAMLRRALGATFIGFGFALMMARR